jgi:hypothetical protein
MRTPGKFAMQGSWPSFLLLHRVQEQLSAEEKQSAALRETFDRELCDYIAGCVQGESGITDCLIEFATKKMVEPEMLSESVRRNPNLLARLEAECMDRHILPKRINN